ncbi:MAG: hypothetical protein WAK55_03830 [Xanthobacteraceae bacterium]
MRRHALPLDKVIRHFGTTPLARVDQDAIDVGGRKFYPNTSAATLALAAGILGSASPQ